MRSSVVETLVHSAWRRRLVVLTAEQIALALLIVCSGAVVMLLAGTQILDWYWLVLLAAVGLSISGWRIQKRIFKRYEVARLIDDRLQLHDSVSTAWFLLAETGRTQSVADAPIVERQLQQAEQIAARIAPEAAFPLVLSRLWIATLALIAVIAGLFTARYLVNSSLSLKPALIHLPFPTSNTLAAEAAEKKKDGHKAGAQGQPVRELLPDHPQDGSQSSSPNQPQTALEAQNDSPSKPNGNQPASGKSSPSTTKPEDGQSASQTGEQSSEQADSKNSDAESKAEQNSKQAQNSKQEKSRNQSKTADAQQSPGLMDKMRDALSGLMAKLQHSSATDNPARDSKTNSANQKAQGQQSAGNKKQNGSPEPNGQKSDSSMDSQSSAQAAAVEKTPASSLGSSNEQMQQSKTNDPQSGAGRQDGEKDLKPAEQLKAMGKLAEIIGKRSANLTGDIKVDRPTEQQQLQTQYSNQIGHHADNGGEINRDEVPPEYQNYVRAYMKEVHKQANATR